MKKLLFIAMMCLSAVTFAKEVKVESESFSQKSSLIMVDFVQKHMFCTVTVNVRWYNSLGAYVGTTSATRSASGQFGCTLAYMMARDAAYAEQPLEAGPIAEENPELPLVEVP